MKRILLTRGLYTLVDDSDYDELNSHKWHALKDGNTYYAVRTVYVKRKGKTVRMHREIMQTPSEMETDHIDGNGLNNVRNNLRNCTKSQNLSNRKPNTTSSSIFKGVSWRKASCKFVAQIQSNGKKISLGYFKKEEDAAHAYDAAAIKYHKEFANLNFK